MKLSLIKYPGGKGANNLNSWVISQLPVGYEGMTYIEPYGGGFSIGLNKLPSAIEVYNDINLSTYLVLKKTKSGKLYSFIKDVPYDDTYFLNCQIMFPNNDLAQAGREYILRNMSRGGMKKDFAWSDRLRGGQPGDLNAWENKLKQLPLIQKRLKKVKLYNRSALEILKQYNTNNSFCYLDPPYLTETRVTKKLYDNEMCQDDHVELLEFLCKKWNGLCLLSGYDNWLYREYTDYYSWNLIKKKVKCTAGQTKKKSNKVECLWSNY